MSDNSPDGVAARCVVRVRNAVLPPCGSCKIQASPPQTCSLTTPLTIESPPRQPRNGDLFAIPGREPERDRGHCLSDHFRHVVAAGYRRRV